MLHDRCANREWESAEERHQQLAIRRAVTGEPGWRLCRRRKNPENYLLAVFHARLGESDQAFESLGRAFQMREPDLIYVKREPAFDAMEGDPRFQALMRELKLP